MADVHLYVPQDLYDEAQRVLPDDVSWSRIFNRALMRELADRVGCDHPIARCTGCGTPVATGNGQPVDAGTTRTG